MTMATSEAAASRGGAQPSEAQLNALIALFAEARTEISRLVVGQERVATQMLLGLMAGGHVLLEGPPGVGKTLLVRTLGEVTGLSFARIQFTPDLMPADISGGNVLVQDIDGTARLQFQQGPVFTQLLLADEINRATPRTQSALLEAMQERTVSVGGRTLPLPRPFFVLATQNPFEMEGTYTLPEAQIDRFLMRIDVGYPDAEVLTRILQLTTGPAEAKARQVLDADSVLALQDAVRAVPVADHVLSAVSRFAISTQPTSPAATSEVKRYVRFGLSPRGAQSIVATAKAHALLHGKFNVGFEDIEAIVKPTTLHRLQLNFDGQSEGIDIGKMVDSLLARARDKRM
jgi:MoxR-like ATPase